MTFMMNQVHPISYFNETGDSTRSPRTHQRRDQGAAVEPIRFARALRRARATRTRVVLAARGLPLRAGPAPSARAICTLPFGTHVEVVRVQGRWVRVTSPPRCGERGAGWLPVRQTADAYEACPGPVRRRRGAGPGRALGPVFARLHAAWALAAHASVDGAALVTALSKRGPAPR